MFCAAGLRSQAKRTFVYATLSAFNGYSEPRRARFFEWRHVFAFETTRQSHSLLLERNFGVTIKMTRPTPTRPILRKSTNRTRRKNVAWGNRENERGRMSGKLKVTRNLRNRHNDVGAWVRAEVLDGVTKPETCTHMSDLKTTAKDTLCRSQTWRTSLQRTWPISTKRNSTMSAGPTKDKVASSRLESWNSLPHWATPRLSVKTRGCPYWKSRLTKWVVHQVRSILMYGGYCHY